MTIQFKLTKENGLTRKITFATLPTWSTLASRITDLYSVGPENIGVSYFDSDGDNVTLSSNDELQGLYTSLISATNGAIKFTVHDLSGPTSPQHRKFKSIRQFAATFRSVAKSFTIRKSNSKSTTLTSASSEIPADLGARCTKVWKRKSTLSLFPGHPRRSKLSGKTYVFGVLGIVGPLDSLFAGWMMSDFGAWAFLLSNIQGYSAERAQWNAVRSIDQFLPDGTIVFGEAGCDRLVLPLPTPFVANFEPSVSTARFMTKCRIRLRAMAEKLQPEDTLILLLVGHGTEEGGEFHFHFSTTPDEPTSNITMTKEDLEEDLENCMGGILLICNSCKSGLLSSDRWTLLCPTNPSETNEQQDAEASSSGFIHGSAFTACALAQVVSEHGLKVPKPRRNDRPLHSASSERCHLPPFPPPHSFTESPPRTLSILRPAPNLSLEEFVQRMLDPERFLVEKSVNTFYTCGSSSVDWNTLLPVKLTPAALNLVRIKPESSTYAETYNETVSAPNRAPNGGLAVEAQMSSPNFRPLLIDLAREMAKITHEPLTREELYTQMCQELLMHIEDPARHISPFKKHKAGKDTFLYIVRSRHIQSIAVQEAARELKWWNGVAEPFFSRKRFDWKGSTLVDHGVRLGKLMVYLARHHFRGFDIAVDRSAKRWMFERWDEAGRPTVSQLEWDAVVTKVGSIIETKVLPGTVTDIPPFI